MIDPEPILVTAKLASITTLVLLALGIPLSNWIARSKSRWVAIVEAMISLPFVLPPSVLGFYLLIAFSPNNFPGNFLKETFDLSLVFTFEGLVVASVLYSLPFMVNPLVTGFRGLPISLMEASATLGKSNFTTLVRILLPNVKGALLTGMVMTFAHTVGEFGVVLMIGGSIPGETKLVSIAVYDEVQAMNYESANAYSAILFAFTFFVLTAIFIINRRNRKKGLI